MSKFRFSDLRIIRGLLFERLVSIRNFSGRWFGVRLGGIIRCFIMVL